MHLTTGQSSTAELSRQARSSAARSINIGGYSFGRDVSQWARLFANERCKKVETNRMFINAGGSAISFGLPMVPQSTDTSFLRLQLMKIIDNDDKMPVTDRECGSCSLCCKLVKVDELNKPAGQWCKHCLPKAGGCQIHGSHPANCQKFSCVWLTSPDFGDEWYPARCKMVLYVEESQGARRLTLLVDSANPFAWRAEPFYGLIKRMARASLEIGQQFVVYSRNNLTVVLPNKDVELGPVKPGDRVKIVEIKGARGHDWDVSLVLKEENDDAVSDWTR